MSPRSRSILLASALIAAGLWARPASAVEPDPCGTFAPPTEQASDSDLAAGLARFEAFLGERPDAVKACPAVPEFLVRVADLSDAMGARARAARACRHLAEGGRMAGEPRLVCARPPLGRGDLDEARNLLRAYVAEETAPAGRLRSIRTVASLLESRARPGMAADFLAEAVALAPGDPETALRHLRNLLEAGRDADAARAAEAAERRLSENREALRAVVTLLARYGRSGPAAQAARSLMRRDGITVDDADAIVVAAAAAGDNDLARAAADALRTAAPPEQRATAVLQAVETLRRHALAGLAAAFLADALDRGDVTDPEARRLLGTLRGTAGDRAGAAAAFEAYLAARGRVPAAVVAVAGEWESLGDPGRAATVLKAAVAGGGSLPVDLWMALGRALHEVGDEAGEHAAYRDAAARSPDPSATWNDVAEHLLGRGDARGAAEAWREAANAASDPERRARASAGLAEALIAGAGDRGAVEKALLAALETGTQDAHILARVERVASRVGENRSLRIAVLESATRREPGRPDLWQRLAVASLEAGRLDDAAKAWTRYVDAAPDRPAALADAVTRLIRAGGLGAGLDLAGKPGNRGAVTPPLAQAVGEACLAIGDVACAARFLKVYLSGPMVLDYDHEALARSLAQEGLTDLALAALDRAARVAAPDRRWEIEIQSGRVLLLAGKAADAEARFARALESSGKKRGVALRIAREIQALGALSRAAAWYARAVADTDEATRLQAVPLYVDCLWRLGREDGIRGVIAGLSQAHWRRAGPLQTAAQAVAATGRFAEAAALLRDGMASVREDERAVLADPEIALLLRAGRMDEALVLAREACRGDAGDDGDGRCLSAANRLEGADRPDLARELLSLRVAAGTAGRALRADLAIRLLRGGDPAGALEQARNLASLTAPDGMLLARLGEVLRDAGLGGPWADLLRRMPRNEGSGADPILAVETARSLLATGDEDGALQATEAWLAMHRGGEARAYLEWVRAGRREIAESFLARAHDDSLAQVDARELQDVAEDLARMGREGILVDLLDRYRKGNEGITAADETVGRVLASLGRSEPAVGVLSRIPERGLSDEGRAALLGALWRTGRRTEALSVALSGFDASSRQRPESSDKPWSRVVLGFFLAEGAASEAVAVLDRTLEGAEPSADLRLLRARLRLRLNGPGEVERGRREFLEILPRLDAANDEAFRFVRDEVRAGRGASLADDLAGARGLRAAESRYLAGCLVGRRDHLDEARRALAGDEPTSARAVLAAARAAFECGRWEEAEPLALRALKGMPRDADPSDAVQIAMASGRMLARKTGKAVEEILAGRSEDPGTVLAEQAEARGAAGDEGGRARALLERTRWALLDPSVAFEAVDSALKAGDGALRKEAEARALAAADDRPMTRRRLADLYMRRLRDDLAAEILAPLATAFPADDSTAGRRVVAMLRAGDAAAASKAADAWVSGSPDPRDAATAVVISAASEMSPDLVRTFLPRVLDGPPNSQASLAAWLAARLSARMGRMEEASVRAGAAAVLAPDPAGLRMRAAQAILTDPEMPAALLAVLDSALGKGATGHPSPAERVLACGEAPTAEAADRCARETGSASSAAAGLVAAADRALAAGRYDAARALEEAADRRMGGSVAIRRAIGARILSYLGGSDEAPLEARRSLGALALGWVESDRVPRDADGGALRGHLSEMARGLRDGVEVYEREIALSPSEGSLRNNLAYLLSLAGGDLERAQREARTAAILAPRGAAFYVETEAWARFLHEGPAAAIPLQERARRAWTVDQGGGVAEGFYHLGRMLEAAGRPAAAREAYRRASVLDPGDWSGVRALRRWRDLARDPNREH